MKFKGTLIGEASGSISGVTFSHNRGGQYTRQRRVPTNPNSARQALVRSRFAGLSQAWRSLTDAQRTGWADIGPTVSLVNTLGDSITYTGQQLYVAVNSVRLDAGLARRDAPPSAAGRCDNTVTSASGADGDSELEIAYTSGSWTALDGALVVQIGGPVSPGVSFFGGPFTLIASVPGAAVAPVSPAVLNYTPEFSDAFRYWVRTRTTDEFGRISEPVILPVTVTG